MIRRILETRAEIEIYFHLFFGSNQNFKICFRDQGLFTNYVYKIRQVGCPKRSALCQRSYHRKCQWRGCWWSKIAKILSTQFVKDPLRDFLLNRILLLLLYRNTIVSVSDNNKAKVFLKFPSKTYTYTANMGHRYVRNVHSFYKDQKQTQRSFQRNFKKN